MIMTINHQKIFLLCHDVLFSQVNKNNHHTIVYKYYKLHLFYHLYYIFLYIFYEILLHLHQINNMVLSQHLKKFESKKHLNE